MDHTQSRLRKCILALIVFGILIYFCCFVFINLFRTKAGIFADATQTGIAGRIFWQYKSVSPENWFAWTESGVFSLALIGACIYGITGSLLLAQSISPVVISCVLLMTAAFLLKEMKLDKDEILIGIFLLLSIPWGVYPQSMAFIYYAAYSICIATAFWQIAIYLRVVREGLRGHYQWIIVAFIIAFAQGSNSSRATLVIYVPLILLDSLRYGIRVIKTKKIWHKNSFKVWMICFALALINYVATYMPWSVRTPMSKALRQSIHKLLFDVIPALLDWVGLDSSTGIIIKIIILCLVLILFFMVGYSLFNLEIEDPKQIVIAFFTISAGLTGVMLSITLTDVTQRYFFIVPYLLIVSFVSFIHIWKKKSLKVVNILLVIILIYACMNMWINYRPILLASDENVDKEQIIEWMTKNEYYYGYADYHDANTITVYSDGKVQISAVDLSNLNMYKWVTDPRWYGPNISVNTNTVYIVSKNKHDIFTEVLEKYPDIEKKFETMNYDVYTSKRNHSALQ